MEICEWAKVRTSGCRRIGLRAAGRWLVPAGAVLAAGCATVAQVTTLSQPACAVEFHQGLSTILAEQGEKTETSDALAERVISNLTDGALGPRPFLVSAPSGTDYEFFVQKKSDACLLRLYGRYHGFVAYTNNLTYIATRPLTRCDCAE